MVIDGSILNNTTREDWEKIGFLHGLPEKNKQEMVSYYTMGIECYKQNPLTKSDRTITVFLPVLRRIYGAIIETKYRFLETPENVEKVLRLVDVEDIYNELDNFTYILCPISETFLESLDAEATMTSLFCENYVFRLIEKVKNSEKLISEMSVDEIKIEKNKAVHRRDYEMAIKLRNEERNRMGIIKNDSDKPSIFKGVKDAIDGNNKKQ